MSGAREYLCYTDGSCKAGDAAPGGWGFHVVPPKGEPIEGSGEATKTQAKIMEYRAVAEAIAVLPEGASAVVFSDNESLVQNLTVRLRDWRASGFANVDPLILESVKRVSVLLEEKRLSVRFQWIRAHNGNAGNERADFLATSAARSAKARVKGRG